MKTRRSLQKGLFDHDAIKAVGRDLREVAEVCIQDGAIVNCNRIFHDYLTKQQTHGTSVGLLDGMTDEYKLKNRFSRKQRNIAMTTA